jgi:ketohexokinase
MLYGLVCRADAWDLETKLGFAVDLATLKVQQEGFRDLDVNMHWKAGGVGREN